MWKLEFSEISFVCALFLGSSALAENSHLSIELPDADAFHAAITINRGLSGAFIRDGEAFLFSGALPNMVRLPLDFEGKTREEKFGLLTDQKRIPLLDAKYPGTWRGAFMIGDRMVAWDASMLQILVMNEKNYKTILSATVPTDLIRPAADRGGEPTTLEIKIERGKFRSISRKIFGMKYTGIAAVPPSWEKGSGANYVVTSKVPGYPLLVMNCRTEDPGSCMMTRHCFMESGPKISPEAVVGVAVMAESKEILIGNSNLNEIDVYKFNSCFDVVWQRKIKLPARLPKISNLTIDAEQRLWVVTPIPDSFTDSNIFYWEKDTWFKSQK